jgi:hypothetical protein
MQTECGARAVSRVLLIYPSMLHTLALEQIWAGKPPLVELLSYLQAKGIEAAVLDLEVELGRPRTQEERNTFLARAADLLSRREFDVVGISCMFSRNYFASVAVAEICRKINGQARIVVGGQHATVMPSDFCYEGSPFDFLVRGQGEIALEEICQGRYTRNGTCQIIQGTPRDMTQDIPLNWSAYQYATRQRAAWIAVSRGCPYACSFCIEAETAASMGTRGPQRWNAHPPDLAFRKVERSIQALRPMVVNLSDPCFGFNPTWRRAFLDRLKKMDNGSCCFWAELRGDLITDEDLDVYSTVDFQLCFGLETGSPRMLQIMRKTSDPQTYLERYRSILQRLNDKEVPYSLQILFNHPGETYADCKATVQYLRSLLTGQKKCAGALAPKSYNLYPGCDVFSNLERYQREYGTVVPHKYWWKEAVDDQTLLSKALIASRDLAERFNGGYEWGPEMTALNEEMRARWPTRVKRIVGTVGISRLADFPPRVLR